MSRHLLQRLRRVLGVLLGLLRLILRRVHGVLILRELLLRQLFGVFGIVRRMFWVFRVLWLRGILCQRLRQRV